MGRSIVRLVSGCFLVACLGAVAVPAFAAATRVRINPGPVTHLLQNASDLVVLSGVEVSSFAGGQAFDFERILSDGTAPGACSVIDQSGCFRVPAGKVLIVTDVEFEVDGTAGESGRLHLKVRNLLNSLNSQAAYVAGTLLTSTSTSVREHFTAGFAVDPAARLDAAWTFGSGNPRIRTDGFIIRGYLAVDR